MNERVKLQDSVSVGSVWVHIASGGRYRVTDCHEGADGYETKGDLIIRVGYVQLEDGTKRQAGSRYSRTVHDFLLNFKQDI